MTTSCVDENTICVYRGGMDALKRAIGLLGTQAAFASAIGAKQSTVSMWLTRGQLPPESVLAVAAATKWQVTPHELRPDLYPNPTDALPVNAMASTKPTEKAAA